MTAYRAIKLSMNVLNYLAIMLVLAISLFPLIWIILTSLKPRIELLAIPPSFIFKPTLSNYRDIFFGGGEGTIAKLMKFPVPLQYFLLNSVIISFMSTFISVGFGVLAGYSLSRFTFRAKVLIGAIILLSRFLPPIATVIPIFMFARDLGLLDTRLLLVIIYSGFNVPLCIFLLKAFFDEVPIELEDAAKIDGCGPFGLIWRITLPLTAPGVVATGIFSFLLSWNDLVFALFLTSREALTAPIAAAYAMTEEGILWGTMSATATLIILPALMFTFFVQKHLVRGLTMGAVKG